MSLLDPSMSRSQIDRRIAARITGSLQFLDGESYTGRSCDEVTIQLSVIIDFHHDEADDFVGKPWDF